MEVVCDNITYFTSHYTYIRVLLGECYTDIVEHSPSKAGTSMPLSWIHTSWVWSRMQQTRSMGLNCNPRQSSVRRLKPTSPSTRTLCRREVPASSGLVCGIAAWHCHGYLVSRLHPGGSQSHFAEETGWVITSMSIERVLSRCLCNAVSRGVICDFGVMSVWPSLALPPPYWFPARPIDFATTTLETKLKIRFLSEPVLLAHGGGNVVWNSWAKIYWGQWECFFQWLPGSWDQTTINTLF